MKESTEELIGNSINETESLKKGNKEDKERNRLLNIFKRLKGDLDKPNNITLRNVLDNYVSTEEKIQKKNIKKTNKFLKRITFYIFLPFLCIIDLVGIFIILLIYKTFTSFFWTTLGFYLGFSEKIPNYDFYDELFNKSLNEPIDFNLVCCMNFLGQSTLKSLGFRISSLIFFGVNCILLIFIYCIDFTNYDPETYDYDFIKLIIIFLILGFMFISVGCSTVLSQQKLIENIMKYNKEMGKEKEKEEEKDKKEKENAIKIENIDNISLNIDNNDNIINEDDNSYKSINSDKSYKSYDSNKIMEKDEEIKLKKKEIINELKALRRDKKVDLKKINTLKNDLKNYQNKEKENLAKENLKNRLSTFYIVCLVTGCGYILKYGIINIWLSKIKYQYDNGLNKNVTNNDSQYLNITDNSPDYINIQNNTIYDEDIYSHHKILFIYIGVIYIICIVFPILLYSIFKLIYEPKNKKTKNSNENENEKNQLNVCCINNIFGCIIYCEKTPTEDSSSKNQKCCCSKCCKLCFKSIKNFCDEIICKSCLCFCCDTNIKCPCCCCCEYNEEDYDKNHECFIYIYREKMFCDWLNKFITNETQREIIPYLIEYFVLQLSTIAFDKEYQIIKKENLYDYKSNLEFFEVFIVCFLYFICLSYLIGNNIKNIKRKYKMEMKMKEKQPIKLSLFQKIFINSNETLFAIHIIFLTNSILASIVSPFKLLGKIDKIIPPTQFKSEIYFCILLNSFFFFNLNYYIMNLAANKKGIELISVSALISVYITFFNRILSFVNSKIESINILYIIQIIFSFIPSLFLVGLYLLLILECCKCLFCRIIFNGCTNCEINECGPCSCFEGMCFCDWPCCDIFSCCYCEYCDDQCSSCDCGVICCQC